MAPHRQLASGFTLIEVLLAVFITSIVMLAVGTTFSATLEARYVIEELSESTAAGPRILALIERDLRGLWTYNIKKNAVLKGRSGDIGSFEADRIDLLTTTESIGYVIDRNGQPRQAPFCEVGYWLKPNPRYRDLMELWRREDPMVDGELTSDGRFQLVHDRIKSFKIVYYKSLGYEAQEIHDWDSSQDSELPRRLKIEFTLERNRSSRNIVNDVEVEDFEGAEKTYVRHFVFDPRLVESLKPGTAMIPVRPVKPEAQGGPGGPAGEGGQLAGGPAGPGGPGGRGRGNQSMGRGDGESGFKPDPGAGQRPMPGMPPGGRPPGGMPPGGLPPGQLPGGINLGDLLRGGGSGSGGLGGLFGGGR